MLLEAHLTGFNLGCALSFVQTLDPGVYITMQGEYFKWNEVERIMKLVYLKEKNDDNFLILIILKQVK